MGTLETVSALLSKAERTDNAHEAEAYLAKAQQLATLASIDLAVARSHRSGQGRPERPVSRTVTIGEPRRRANTHLVELFAAVGAANDVVVDVGAGSTYVIAYGMPSDLDLVATMWGSLAHQMVTAANAYLRAGMWRGESYQRVLRYRGAEFLSRERRPHTAQTARAAFYQAFIARMRERLQTAREEAIAEHDVVGDSLDATGTEGAGRRRPARGESGALVLAAKHEEVQAFHRSTTKARGNWGGYRGSGRGDAGSASRAGRRAASDAQLRPPRGIGGSGPSLSA